ncbi:hypothetical protein C8R44DRAFT_229696 [Mycena epipterygia]|nr:hypothetical protein C8R44DRAFT_229696 [Mycena epipterygia]
MGRAGRDTCGDSDGGRQLCGADAARPQQSQRVARQQRGGPRVDAIKGEGPFVLLPFSFPRSLSPHRRPFSIRRSRSTLSSSSYTYTYIHTSASTHHTRLVSYSFRFVRSPSSPFSFSFKFVPFLHAAFITYLLVYVLDWCLLLYYCWRTRTEVLHIFIYLLKAAQALYLAIWRFGDLASGWKARPWWLCDVLEFQNHFSLHRERVLRAQTSRLVAERCSPRTTATCRTLRRVDTSHPNNVAFQSCRRSKSGRVEIVA